MPDSRVYLTVPSTNLVSIKRYTKNSNVFIAMSQNTVIKTGVEEESNHSERKANHVSTNPISKPYHRE